MDLLTVSRVESAWRKLRTYIEEVRRDESRDTFAEWAQWLAERMLDRESDTPSVPAHVAHRSWEPKPEVLRGHAP